MFVQGWSEAYSEHAQEAASAPPTPDDQDPPRHTTRRPAGWRRTSRRGVLSPARGCGSGLDRPYGAEERLPPEHQRARDECRRWLGCQRSLPLATRGCWPKFRWITSRDHHKLGSPGAPLNARYARTRAIPRKDPRVAERYLVQFEVDPQGDSTAKTERLAELATNWANRAAARAHPDGPSITADAGRTEWGPDEWAEVERVSVEGAATWALHWQHPDRNGGSYQWVSDVRLATIGGLIEVRVEVKPVANDLTHRAESPNVGAPGVVADIVGAKDVPAQFREHPLSAAPVPIAKGAAGLVLAKDRRLPLVVVTRTPAGRTLVSSKQLARVLAGLANVIEIDGPEADRMNEQLGAALSCYNGGVRTYYAGLRLDDRKRDHPVCSPVTLSYLARAFPLIVLSQLLERSTRFHDHSPIWDQASGRISSFRRDRLRQSVEASTLADFDELLVERDALIASQVAEISQLREERNKALDEARVKTTEAKSFRRENVRLRELSKTNPVGSDDDEYASVSAAVAYADIDFETLRIWPTAEKSSRSSPFRSPKEVYETLEVVDMLGQQLRESGGQLDGVDYAEWFRDIGIRYIPHESQTTVSRYGKERTFLHPVTRDPVLVEPHIAVGSSSRDPSECLRIHLYWNREEQVWEIAYVGEHLQVAST